MENFENKLLVLTSTFPFRKDDPTPSFVFELSKHLSTYFNVVVLAPFSKDSSSLEIVNERFKIVRFKYWLNTSPLLADRAILPMLKK